MVLPLLIALGAVAQPVGLAWHITNLTEHSIHGK
jgi:hypothetical protein